MSQTRTFVFVTNIPDFLLEPLEVSNHISSRARANRDPRYERLRALLAANTSGVMIVMHLETRGYALALYASEQEALAACKTTIIPQNGGGQSIQSTSQSQQQSQYPPLQLRILRRERPAPCEAVYTPTLTVEGSTVQKSDLVPTRGLELVYRGRAVPRWCPHTQAHEDCPFGTSCHRLHLKAYQHTVRKRPRLDAVVGTGGATTATTTTTGGLIEAQMTREEMELVRSVTRSTRLTEELLVPPEMRLDFSVYVSITREEALSLVGHTESTASSDTIAATATAVRANIVRRVEESCLTNKGPYFVKFAFPGGAPWDWSLHDESEGLPQLRQRVPFPENGAPTPLERDLFCQQLLYHVNQMNRFTTIDAALRAFETSPRVCEALHQYLQDESEKKDNNNNNTGDSSNTSITIELCVRPWLFLPTAGMEAIVLLENGGEYVRGVAQRHAALRLMTSATFLQHHQLDFTRYAVIGNNEDPEAEDALEMELRRVGAVVKHGVEALRRQVRQQCTREKLPATAAWCIQLAVVLPDSLVMEENNNSNNNNNNNSGSVSTTTESGETSAADVSTMRTVVLSLRPYQSALEEFTAIYGTRQDVRGDDNNDRVRKEVLWNTKKHPYIPLFPRELMERLKRDGNE